MPRSAVVHAVCMLLPMPDRGPSPSPVDVRTLLCEQSGALHGAIIRLRNAGAELAVPAADGWRGTAERAQATVVAQLAQVVETVSTTLESARQHTDTAIWSMSDVG